MKQVRQKKTQSVQQEPALELLLQGAEPAGAVAKVSTRPPGRPTKAEGIKLRNQLLQIAAREFLKLGFSGTTIEAIAARSKIGKMTIYRHFPSKEALFRAVVQQCINERFANDLARIPQEGRDIREVLSDFIMAFYGDPATEEILGITRIVMAEAESFPDLVHTLYEHNRRMLAPLTRYLEQMSENGTLVLHAGAEMAAFQLVALASGGLRALMIPRAHFERSRARWVLAALEIFLNGSLNRKAGDGR